MRLTYGNLRLEPHPLSDLPGYGLILKVDWRQLGLGFTELAHWSCRTGRWTPAVPEKVVLGPNLLFTALTPLGRVNKTLLAARQKRMLGATGMKPADFVAALRKDFPLQPFTVPKAQIEALASETVSLVAGFWRYDRHILLTPPAPNKTGDFVILSLPDYIEFAVYVVDTCGGATPPILPDNILRRPLDPLAFPNPFGAPNDDRYRGYVPFRINKTWDQILRASVPNMLDNEDIIKTRQRVEERIQFDEILRLKSKYKGK